LNKLLSASIFALFFLFLLPIVYAQGENNSESTDNDDSKTLPFWHVIGYSVCIVVTGVMIHTTLGYLKGREKNTKEWKQYNNLSDADKLTKQKPKEYEGYDRQKLARSFLVAPISGIILVMPQVQNMVMSNPIDNVILSVTLVATVAGIDAVSKKAGLNKD